MLQYMCEYMCEYVLIAATVVRHTLSRKHSNGRHAFRLKEK